MGGAACRYFNVSQSVVLYQPSNSQHFCCFQARIEEQLEDRGRKIEALTTLLEEQKREAQGKVECVAVVHRGKHLTEMETEMNHCSSMQANTALSTSLSVRSVLRLMDVKQD